MAELTPEQRAQVTAGIEVALTLNALVGAGIGALVAGKGARGKGAVMGAAVLVVVPALLHALAVERVKEVAP